MPIRSQSDLPLPRAARVLRSALRSFLRARRPLLAAEVVLKLVTLGLGAAASTLVLARVMARTGNSAVTNTDIARFLLTPWAILGVVLAATAAVVLMLAEQAVLMSVASLRLSGPRHLSRGAILEAGAALARLARLGVLMTGVFVVAVVPAVAVAAMVYRGLLSEHDINFYLSRRPPEFVHAIGITAVPVLATAAGLAILYVRWLFAIPIALFEGGSARIVLAESARRVRGAAWRIAGILVGWHLSMLAIGAGSHFVFRLTARKVLDSIGTGTATVLVSVVLLFLVQGALVALVSFVAATGHALITLALYSARKPGGRSEERSDEGPALPVSEGFLGRGKLLIAASAVLVVITIALAARGAALLRIEERTQVTAHRGFSKVAPENTLSAVQKAIQAGADWSEIDVQETADGVVVVLHDRDLMRLAGDGRRLADLRYDELQKIDVGSRFSPEYAGERVPRLEDVIDAVRGRMKLNIELKYYGPDPRLARDVARILRDKQFEGDCFVASLQYDSLAEARAANPRLRTAAIVSAALGDVLGLDVDVLSLRADLVTRSLLRSAHDRLKEVHVWTIDDRSTAAQLMERGVDNVITNDVETIVRLRNERAGLTGPERLLHAFRSYLGIEEKPAPIQAPLEL